MAVMQSRPSPSFGFRMAARLWLVVVTAYLVQTALVLPAVLVVMGSIGVDLDQLPAGGGAEGDALLIVASGLQDIGPTLIAVVATCLILSWLWTVLWHAGVVNWRLWDEADQVRLSHVLGLGLRTFWRFMRLSLCSTLLTLVVLVAIWKPLDLAIERAAREMAALQMMVLISAGAVLSVFLLWVIRAAALRAAWMLGRHDRRSAFLALMRSLIDTIRHPVSNLGVVALWTLPAVAAAAAPIGFGYLLPFFRGGLAGATLSQAAHLVACFFWMGLFASFAPVSGLVEKETARPARPDGRQVRYSN